MKPGRTLQGIAIRDLDRDVVETLGQPTIVAPGEPADAPDWLLLAVRCDQINEALPLAQRYLASHTTLVVVPPLMHDLIHRVRGARIDQPVIAMLVGFGAWPVGAELHWFRLPDAACLLSAEGDATVLPAAESFAAALAEAGLPALARLAIPTFVRALVASEYALLLGWELVGWDIDRLSADPELCTLTTGAMADAIRVVANESGATESILEGMPSLEHRVASMNENLRAIWRFHGPKIALQTRQLVDGLIDEAQKTNVSVDSLMALRARLRSTSPPLSDRSQPEGDLPGV